MIDLSELGLPATVDAHDKTWQVVQRLTVDAVNTYYLGFETAQPMPQPLMIVAVPLTQNELDGRAYVEAIKLRGQ